MCYIIFNLQKPCDPFSLKQTHLPATKINKSDDKFSKFLPLKITAVVEKFLSKNSIKIHHMLTFKLDNISQASLYSQERQ